MTIGAFLLRRTGLALITLALLSVIVFAGAQLLPGDVGRAVLGPLADPRAVALFDHKIGADRPVLVQYASWAGDFLEGDMGRSYVLSAPVAPFVMAALGRSLKLAGLAFVLVVPLGIIGGVIAALKVDRPLDRIITIGGISLTTVPEFVSGIVLILLLGVWLRVLPVGAAWRAGAGPLDQLRHLILPAIPLVLVLFGYIARMARAGTVEALDAEYTRTAILKGLTWRRVIWRHVLPNALLPTITVIASQISSLIGGLGVVDTLFHYQGIGSLIFTAARDKDFPMLAGGILTIGIVAILAGLVADILYAALNPRIRYEGSE
ncbi:MAG: ABC transporter permease [Acetobacteraceae bacterium]